ncbi:Protein sidekick-1 [Triplophysa tibetana]|uniref:Protein sidekick-1 n=1 Tax=Triplophysa tibetana TaxID=1572043 RepID=A0A5A9PN00_9TELE|nr:Protein sidekick-1 [Triplophysa tibetana]
MRSQRMMEHLIKATGNDREAKSEKDVGENARDVYLRGCDALGKRSHIAPYFKTEAGGAQTHLEGNRLVLTCLAEGSWPLEFKWIRNTTDITEYSPEYRYKIASLDREDAGVYQCVVRNRMGALIQTRADVRVAYMDNFAELEQRKTIAQGRAAVLNPPAVASYPRPQVTWFREGYKIIPNHRIAITLDNQLVVLGTTAADAGRYYVQAVNERNGENKTSASIYLSIANSVAPAELVAPVIVIAPKNTSVVAGANEATLECVANARSLDRLQVFWKRNGVRLTTGVDSFGRRLVISNPTSADTGLYVCEAALRNSSQKSTEAKAYLSVLESPYFTSRPNRTVISEIEKNIELQCQVKGVPVPKLEWFKDAVPLSKLNNTRYKLISMILQVRKVQPDDTGIFQCFAENTAGQIQAYTNLVVTSMSPSFTTPPSDITVTDGTLAVFSCETSGAPKPAIVWRKGSQVLASGTVQVPRFTLLESGGLQILPIMLSDAGNYTCSVSNTEGLVSGTGALTVLSRTFVSTAPDEQRVIKGTTAVLKCAATHDPRVTVRYSWKRGNRILSVSTGGRVSMKEGSLHISQTWSGDIGDYTCRVTSPAGNDSKTARLEVIELPHSPRNLQVALNETDSRTVLLSWVRPFDGNSPLLHYIIELSENNSPWKVYMGDVSPSLTSLLVSGLTPARTYQFRICAVNQVGRGQYSPETNRLMLREEPPSAPPKNIVASGRTNQSIMVQWQPPPELQLNGVLRGYVLRYRLAGLPGEFQLKNITSAEINYCLIGDLIIWTQYEIQVAAYTGAGLGVYSQSVTEYTLQGVPTAPPQDSEAVAVNSTTIKFTWTPPPQQFINGINQGYKLLVWPEHCPECITMVTIAPEFHGSRHYGYVTDLKKFTWYETVVLCFTTPGDGPASMPQLIQTHADKPGPVSRLSFTEILDTSLKVSWQEPKDKNGIITGYVLCWEEAVENESRVTHTLSNSTLVYKVTGLTSLTMYTLQVAAVTQAGTGTATSSTISTGLPPELPGAPSNLVISNISPRSATIRFRPGSDGKTDISKWIVEGQVGTTEETKEWKVLYERDNPPTSGDSLEIPNLIPFTHYRFRMRQVNVVGSSPFSQPSTLMQTLQASPDVAPPDLSVLSATETSLRIRWQPLAEADYNGNPESVGYHVRARRSDGLGQPRIETVNDRQSREVTVEGLEEWMEYEVSVQAFNAIGSGPWSSPVLGKTKESVPSGAPENVSAEAMSSTSVLVTWGSVPEHQKNGHILGYKVLYKEKDLEQAPQVQPVNGNQVHSLLLRNLSKFILYEVQVLAFTRVGEGPPSIPPTIERTKDDGYQISYRLDVNDPNKFTTVEVGSNARQFTVSGLNPESAYVFQIQARTQQGWGPPDEAIVITTEKRERPQPTRRLTTPQKGVESRKLRLQWTAGGDGSSPVRYYTLQTLELPDGEWKTHTSSIGHNNTSWDVDRLKPYTSYKFRMMATNDVGESAFSKETEPVTTLQDELTKYRRYEIVMTAFNVVGESPLSAPVELFVGEAVAPQNIQVKAVSSSQLDVEWQPPPVETQNGNIHGYKVTCNDCDSSRIHYWEKDKQNDTEKELVLFIPETSVHLKNLTSYTTYHIQLSAFNAAGGGPLSAARKGRTLQAAPGPPSHVLFSEVTGSSLNVSWGAPLQPNGVLEGYRVIYEPTAPVHGVSKIVTVDIKGNWQRWLKVRDLMRGVVYRFKVQARTITYGPELEANVTAGPVEGSPGSPLQTSITKSASALTLHWSEGAEGVGPVTGYVIESRPSDEGLWDTFVKHLPPGSFSYTISLDRLRSGVAYEFRVIAVNRFGYGDPSPPSTAMSGNLPHYFAALWYIFPSFKALSETPFYEEWWFLVVMALISLILILMVVFGKHISTVEEAVTLDNGGFTALELNSRHLNVKSTFLKKNGTRSPPRPSPGGLHYSDEDICNNYNGAVLTESTTLTEKPTELSESEVSDSDYEDDHPKHSFVNHYMSDPTYYNSWKRQPKSLKTGGGFEDSTPTDAEGGYYQTVVTQHSVGGVYTPTGQPAPGTRTPVTGFSSFV